MKTFVPSFSAKQIDFLCRELTNEIVKWELSSCLTLGHQKFLLSFESKNISKVLFFSFSPPLSRFYLTSKNFPPQFISLYQPLNAYLQGTHLQTIEALNEDRIIRLHFSNQSKNYYLYCEFFSKYANFYLTLPDHRILQSLHPTKEIYYQLPHPNPSKKVTGLPLSSKAIETLFEDYEDIQKLKQIKFELFTFITKNIKKHTQTLLNLENQLKACQEWQKIQHQADLIKANLTQYKKNMAVLEVWDWLKEENKVIHLNPKLTLNEEMVLLYKRASKLQKGYDPTLKQINKVLERLKNFKCDLEKLETFTTFDQFQALRLKLIPHISKRNEKIKEEKKKLPYYIYYSEKRTPIWVGKNAKANEILTFKLANGNDWWLHARDVAGSHVIIKANKVKELDNETLQDALQLALFHSKAQSKKEGEVCLTQKKYISKLGRDKIGKVQISQHKTYHVLLDLQLYKKIKERVF